MVKEYQKVKTPANRNFSIFGFDPYAGPEIFSGVCCAKNKNGRRIRALDLTGKDNSKYVLF